MFLGFYNKFVCKLVSGWRVDLAVSLNKCIIFYNFLETRDKEDAVGVRYKISFTTFKRKIKVS
jgi:hypothetical protein